MTTKGKSTGAAQRPTSAKPKADAYISFNKAETAALQGVDLRSLRVYFELKWLANFRTGVAGTFGRQKLSYEAIADRVAIPTTQGRSAASNTIDGKEVSRIIGRLEQAGLVKDVFNSKQGLTLRLPLSPLRVLPATQQAAEEGVQEEMQDELQPVAPIPLHDVLPQPEPFRAAIPEPQQAPVDDEDDWDRDEPEPASSPATWPISTGIETQKLPTDPVPESTANPHEQTVSSASDPHQSVLVKTEGQYSFSVHGQVLDASARSALAQVGSAGAPTEPLGEPRRLAAAPVKWVNPNLDAGQIKERIRVLYPQFSYLDTQVSATFFQRAAGLDITVAELDEAARSLAHDPKQKLTAGALFDCLVARRRRPRRLPGGLVL